MMRGDRTFQQALKAKRGALHIPAKLVPLADRIYSRFGERPLWITVDTIPGRRSPGRTRPRLDVVFERTAQFKQFESTPYSFDAKRQAVIADDYEDLVRLPAWTRLFQRPHGRAGAADILVCFSNFESAAIEEAHQNVSMGEIDKLARRHFGADFWQASRLFAAPVIFLRTDAQVATYQGSPLLDEVSDEYSNLVAQHDEFGYFDRRASFVPLDSKENFDANYSSNWYYYWK